jgi:hypothetical protein
MIEFKDLDFMESNSSIFKIKRILKPAFTYILLFLLALLAMICVDHFSTSLAQGIVRNTASVQTKSILDGFAELDSSTKTLIYFGILVFHIYLAACLQIIAKKVNLENTWLAWIPLLQFILLVQAAGKPNWQFLLLLVPLVNIIFLAMLMYALPHRLGKCENVSAPALLFVVIISLSPLGFPLYFFLMAFT